MNFEFYWRAQCTLNQSYQVENEGETWWRNTIKPSFLAAFDSFAILQTYSTTICSLLFITVVIKTAQKLSKSTDHSQIVVLFDVCSWRYTARCHVELGIATASRLSVCQSVTLGYHDHIGWKSSKIISWLVSQFSLSADPKMTDLLQRKHPKILAQSDPPVLNWVLQALYHDPLPDSYLLHDFVIENAYQAAASREPKSGSLYKWVST